jgi:hypothetical protein
MSKKLKGRANPLAELHFIADVPLEQAVMLIGNLADDVHVVMLTEVDANNFKFEIDDTREKSSQSKINGTLQRWQGTETRVDVTGDVVRQDLFLVKITSYLMPLLLLSVVPLLMLSAALLVRGETLFSCITISLFVASLFAIAVDNEPQEETIAPVYFRERDRLLQLIIDTFKSAGKVEAYDIEKGQELLHRDTSRETYRGDATGDSDRQTSTSGRG